MDTSEERKFAEKEDARESTAEAGTSLTAEAGEGDEADSLTDQLAEAADDHVSGMVAALRRELDAAVEAGESFEEFSKRLYDLYPALDVKDLTEALEGAFMAANLAGREHAGN